MRTGLQVRSSCTVLAFTAFLQGSPFGGGAATAMMLSQQGSRCAGCSVSVSLEAVLGTDDGPGFLGSPSGFMTTPAGGYLVTDSYNPAELKVFAPDGSFSRVVGRKGRGPGEFEFAAHLLPAEGDSLWVVDVGLLRRNLFSATLDFGRSVPFKAPAFSVVAPNPQAFVVNARIYTDSAIGLPLHLVEASGGIVRSFGAVEPIEDLRRPEPSLRSITVASDSSVWALPMDDYRLEEWSLNGTLLRTVTIDSDWFVSGGTMTRRPDEEPTTILVAAQMDPRGFLWVIGYEPDPQWQEAFGDGEDPYGRSTKVLLDRNLLYDTRVEVVDPGSGEVVASRRLEQAIRGFGAPGRVFSVSMTAQGAPRMEISSVNLSEEKRK